MRTVFDDGCGTQTVDRMLGNEMYRSVREVAEISEEIKHLAQYMPQLYRLFELTKDLTTIIEILTAGIVVRSVFSVSKGNLAAGQTVFPIPGGFFAGTELVAIERMVLIPDIDYTISNNSIVLTDPAKSSDVILVRATKSNKTNEVLL